MTAPTFLVQSLLVIAYMILLNWLTFNALFALHLETHILVALKTVNG